ncbi:hypothetical protein CL617_05500 [archaeon]|nr:hypothetical protein [archaeon]|tara:strand:- start:1301 stop:1663 length:363 start_codon:yes stop_codon:yes gene_type:complete
MFNFFERITKKVSERNLRLGLTSEILIILVLGSMFSIELVKYGYFILLGAMLLIFHALNVVLFNWYKNSKTNFRTIFYGIFGFELLIFFIGIQTPQVPLKIYILIAAILIGLPSVRDMFK